MRSPLRLVLALLVLGGAASPPSVRYEVAAGSQFWIDGNATTGRWTCQADAVRGHGLVGEAHELAAQVTVPVRDFDCGSGPMNRDLYHALAAEAHPAITFDLDTAETLREAPAGGWARVRATGTLRLAGVARRVTVDAEGRRLAANRVALRGEHRLRMTDFDVTPPSHALGLVRAHDAIRVRFDLTATAR